MLDTGLDAGCWILDAGYRQHSNNSTNFGPSPIAYIWIISMIFLSLVQDLQV